MKPDITIQVNQTETLISFSLANLVQTGSVELKTFSQNSAQSATHSTHCKRTLMTCCASSCWQWGLPFSHL